MGSTASATWRHAWLTRRCRVTRAGTARCGPGGVVRMAAAGGAPGLGYAAGGWHVGLLLPYLARQGGDAVEQRHRLLQRAQLADLGGGRGRVGAGAGEGR